MRKHQPLIDQLGRLQMTSLWVAGRKFVAATEPRAVASVSVCKWRMPRGDLFFSFPQIWYLSAALLLINWQRVTSARSACVCMIHETQKHQLVCFSECYMLQCGENQKVERHFYMLPMMCLETFSFKAPQISSKFDNNETKFLFKYLNFPPNFIMIWGK